MTKTCPHDELCGGCIYQGTPYKEQLRIKEDWTHKLASENGIKPETFAAIESASNVYGYRNKMDYTFGDLEKGGEMTLGMHQKGRFMSIVTTDSCQLVPGDFNRVLAATLEFCKEKGYRQYHKRRHDGLMRNLVLRRGVHTEELLVNIITTDSGNIGKYETDSDGIQEFEGDDYAQMLLGLELDAKICGIIHTVCNTWSDAIKTERTRVLYGRDYYTEQIMDLDFRVSAFSFFQTNVEAVERLYSEAISLIEDVQGKIVFDLFCGTGTITQTLAKRANKVVGVEIVEEAVVAATENAKSNGLGNCEFIAGDVLKVLPTILAKPDVVVVDPPRAGIHPKVLPMIATYGTKEILYISCNPKTLFKDLKYFCEHGYECKYAKPYDNFPFTSHVECICLMTRVKD